MTDYERAMRSALRKIYPGAELYNCWFHYCQALRRHANAIPGFVPAVRSNMGALEIYGKFLCLPLLPAAKIEGAFTIIKAEAESYDANLFRRFLKYYEKQWMKLVVLKIKLNNTKII